MLVYLEHLIFLTVELILRQRLLLAALFMEREQRKPTAPLVRQAKHCYQLVLEHLFGGLYQVFQAL
jgi:hypothetical protein